MAEPSIPTAADSKALDSKMIVFGVAYTTSKDAFREYFAQFGELLECELMYGRDGKSRGFGFVLFKDDEINKKVMGMTGLNLDGRNLDIKMKENFSKPEFAARHQSSQQQKGGEALKSKKIFIGRLSDEVTNDDLREHFEQYGTIIDIFMPVNHATGRKKNCGFIEFETYESAEAAISEPRHIVKGVESVVQLAEPKDPSRPPREGYGGYREGYGGGYPGSGLFGGRGYGREDFFRERGWGGVGGGGDRYGMYGREQSHRSIYDERERERYAGVPAPVWGTNAWGAAGAAGGAEDPWGHGWIYNSGAGAGAPASMQDPYGAYGSQYGYGGAQGVYGAAMPSFGAAGAIPPAAAHGRGMYPPSLLGGFHGDGGGGSCKVLVDGLRPGTKWSAIKDFFKQYGYVTRAECNPQGEGSVMFETPDAARKALSANGLVIADAVARVRMADV